MCDKKKEQKIEFTDRFFGKCPFAGPSILFVITYFAAN